MPFSRRLKSIFDQHPRPTAIGGLLAKPSERYSSFFPQGGLFGEFPYLLPNLVCSILLLFSIISGWLFLQETRPSLQPWSLSEDLDNSPAEHPLLPTTEAVANSGTDLGATSYGTFDQVHSYEDEERAFQADGPKTGLNLQEPSAFTWQVAMLILALGIFSYHSMTYDHLFPIFLQDDNTSAGGNSGFSIPGGVGLSTRAVGLIMSTDGIIALIIQSLIFPIFAELLGVWRLFALVTVLHPVAYFIVPFLVFLPPQLLYIGIYACLIVRNILHIIDYPLLLILIKRESPSNSCLGKINGLAASAGAAARTIAPPIAGLLYSIGSQIDFTAIAWWGSAFVAVIGALQLWFIKTGEAHSKTVRCNLFVGFR